MSKIYSPPMSKFMLYSACDDLPGALELWRSHYPEIKPIGDIYPVSCHSENYEGSWVGNVISDTEYKAVTVDTGDMLYTLLFAEDIQSVEYNQ